MRHDALLRLRRLWRHRWRQIALGAVVVLVLAGTFLDSLQADEDLQGRARLPSRIDVCAAARNAPDPVVAEQACTTQPAYAPGTEPRAIPATPGCHMTTKLRRRGGAPLPASGTPVVGGVRLPRGSRCGPFWSTDAGVEDAYGLARRLAAVFPATGVWPVVWTVDHEPDDMVGNGEDPGPRVRRAEALLREGWRTNRPGDRTPFPGLAAGSRDVPRGDPFGDALRESAADPPPPGGWIVMLVPVERPADVLRVLRLGSTQYFTDDELAVVLRSWEDRFGAVLSSLTVSTIGLTVAAPPGSPEQARRLAIEHAAVANGDEGTWDLADLAERLRSDEPVRGWSSGPAWHLGWAD